LQQQQIQEEEKGFNLTDRDFNFIRNLVSEETGIVLSEAKRNLVYGRLARRIRTLGLADFSSYCNMLKNRDGDEIVDFINAITTNLTSFFRENHHFEFLANTVIPKLLQTNVVNRRIRIWSAGCSTGEEPYSIAMTLRENIPNIESWDVKILATDLDSNVLATAAAGIYSKDRVTGIAKPRQKKWFLTSNNESLEDKVQVSKELKDLITFKQLNLMQDWPFKGHFDCIFCRNVVIYFSKDTQRVLVNRYADKMAEDAHLFLGHSESLFKVSDRFKLLGQTIYQRTQ